MKCTHLPLNRNRFFCTIIFSSARPFSAFHLDALAHLSKFAAQSKREVAIKSRRRKERSKRMNPMVDCAVQMHAWDNKLNVVYMYVSNLSRIALISWTNDMFGAYIKSIRSVRIVRTCRIQMNASYGYSMVSHNSPLARIRTLTDSQSKCSNFYRMEWKWQFSPTGPPFT